MRLKHPKAVAAVALVPLLVYVIHRGSNRGSDFKYPYGAARLLWTTGELHVRAQPRYPVTLHVLLAPLASCSLRTAVTVWAALSIAAVAALPRTIARLSGIEPRRQILAWALVAPFFIDALILGQSDPINILLVSAGLLAAKEGHGLAGAGLVGLAGMVKILPAAHWGTLIVRRRSWDVFAGVALAVAVGLGLVVAAVGWGPAWDGFRAQTEWVSEQEKPWQLVARGSDLRPNNESLPIVLARTFCELPPGRRDANALALARLPLHYAWVTWWVTLACLVSGWVAAIGPAGRVEPSRGWLGMLALTSIVMLAATPICWNHYFLWSFPAALFLAHRPRLIATAAVASLFISASQAARGLGGHMGLALGLYVLVVYDLWRESRRTSRPVAAGNPIRNESRRRAGSRRPAAS
jgi:alpha-1,2-mannosyltransferase